MADIGDVLGEKYVLTRLLGKGGMGEVYEAEHQELGKRVAIKIPTEKLLDDEKALARFKREPKVAAATGHRGIVEVHDIGTTDEGVPFVVMEALEGESFGSLLTRKGRVDLELVTYVIAQVLSALSAAHRRGIIHRDLKPDNIFLVETGQPLPDVKLLDFGTIIGTPFYMAPEQITNEPDLDQRLDIYGVGVVFYEAVTGKLPFVADNIYGLVNQVLNEDLPSPRQELPELPIPIEEAILRALARKREERYGSADSMLQALLPHLTEQARARIWLPDGLRDGPAAAPGDGEVDTTAPTRSAHDTETPLNVNDVSSGPRKTPTSSNRMLLAGGVVVVLLLSGVGLYFGGVASLDDPPGVDHVAPGSAVTDAGEAAAPGDAATWPAAADGADAETLSETDGQPDRETTLVTLDVRGLPPDAVVTIDGVAVAELPARLPLSTDEQELLVKVGRRELLRQPITLDSDMRLVVASQGHGSARPQRPAKAPPQQPEEPNTDNGSQNSPGEQRPVKLSNEPMPWQQ